MQWLEILVPRSGWWIGDISPIAPAMDRVAWKARTAPQAATGGQRPGPQHPLQRPRACRSSHKDEHPRVLRCLEAGANLASPCLKAHEAPSRTQKGGDSMTTENFHLTPEEAFPEHLEQVSDRQLQVLDSQVRAS